MNNIFALGTLNYIWSHPGNASNRISAVVKFVGWQFYKRLTKKFIDIQLVPGIKLRCYPDSRSASAVLYCGLYDYHEMNFLLRYLRPEDSFIDVGANVGVYTLLAASIIQSGSIHSFEALPKNYERLRENLKLNQLQQVHFHEIAVSDRRGQILLNTAEGDSMPFITTQATEKTIRVSTDTLDHLLSDHPLETLALGKMDIEGAEIFAFKGATSLLRAKHPPIWILEILDSTSHAEYQKQNVVNFLKEYGYNLYNYDTSTNQVSLVNLENKQGNNVLAIADSALDVVRNRLSQASIS